MEGLINFFGNPWVIGIGTGAISGLSVNLVSRFLWNKKDNKEYKQKVNSANNEIIYSLRSSVAEASMPTKDVTEAVARATARRYDLKREMLFDLNEITDTLIKEVMDSNFLSHAQKEKYTNEIASVVQKPDSKDKDVKKHATDELFLKYRNRIRYQYINMLSFLTAISVTVLSALALNQDGLSDQLPANELLIIATGAVAITLLLGNTAPKIADLVYDVLERVIQLLGHGKKK